MSPGEFRQRDQDGESGRQPGDSCLKHTLESRDWHLRVFHRARTPRSCLLALGFAITLATNLLAADPPSTPAASPATGSSNTTTGTLTNAAPHFDVQSYVINYTASVFTNAPALPLSNYIGTNLSLERIVQAASDVLLEFQKQGYLKANISIAQEQITNGVVTMNVFQGAFPKVLVSGKTCFLPGEMGIAPAIALTATNATNATTTTNVEQRFPVRAYEITGDTLLSTNTLMSILAKGTGTNVSLSDIIKAASDLQLEYRNRGYPTVSVSLPPQNITNGIVKIRVFEGRLSDIQVTYANPNHYFSSNNVMRALPGLHTNMIIVGPLFGAELDRANANQDRQIYPQIMPGLEPNTTTLKLVVHDRLPLHAKVELNNQNSPGTPDLRVNSSAVYDNLWQLNHSLGVQYSFSPEQFKLGEQWAWYDRPLVANYSGFYRLPLGNPGSIAEQIASQPGTFGYSEATRKFNLPAPSGVPELNLYASRSTIDTGLELSSIQTIYDVPGVRQVFQQNVQEDLTVNNVIGFRLSDPAPDLGGLHSILSTGLDYKTYNLLSTKTNNFQFTEITVNAMTGNPNPPIVSTVSSPVPVTVHPLQYLPVTLRYDGNWRDGLGPASFGLGLTVDLWHSGSKADLQSITGSLHSEGHWVTLNPSFSQDFVIHSNWVFTIRADGQWASEPLISNEQFGSGGVASVRGYHEGEIFGDTGWHVTLEQKTPGHIVGSIGHHPLIFRGSIYMDYAETYLLDPQGRAGRTPLWGTGFGAVASIGSSWEARFLFSVPLLSAGTIEAYQPYFNFSLTAQF